LEEDFTAWGANLTFPIAGGGVIRWFDKTKDAFVDPQIA
jgi:hypothetical protein